MQVSCRSSLISASPARKSWISLGISSSATSFYLILSVQTARTWMDFWSQMRLVNTTVRLILKNTLGTRSNIALQNWQCPGHTNFGIDFWTLTLNSSHSGQRSPWICSGPHEGKWQNKTSHIAADLLLGYLKNGRHLVRDTCHMVLRSIACDYTKKPCIGLGCFKYQQNATSFIGS